MNKTTTVAADANAHLKSTCEPVCRIWLCGQRIKQGPNGRWFLTMGHAGFNSPANNRDGYKTWRNAKLAQRAYETKGAR